MLLSKMRKSFLRVLSFLIMLTVAGSMSAKAALAGPHFTFSPVSGSYTNGSTFAVGMGVDSGTEKVAGMDVVGSFDATRLELLSVDKAASPAFDFPYDSSTAKIHNDTGKFEISLVSKSSSIYDATTAVGPLLTFNFRAKSNGTATVSLTCQPSSIVESNIINQNSIDTIDCTANQIGSYTISGGSSTNLTPVPTSASTTTTSSSSGSELPKTGNIGSTVGLLVFGSVSVIGAFLLRFL